MQTLIDDLDVYAYGLGLGKWSAPLMIFIFPVTWSIVAYRFGNWVFNNVKTPFIKHFLLILYFILKRFTEICTSVEISHKAQIGKGLYIMHPCVVIGTTKIGEYCMFVGGVTIGLAGRNNNLGVPTVGNYVYFGTGSKNLGNISIGNNVMIGANSVVIKSIPDDAVVAGVPGKIISYKGSKDYIYFKGR